MKVLLAWPTWPAMQYPQTELPVSKKQWWSPLCTMTVISILITLLDDILFLWRSDCQATVNPSPIALYNCPRKRDSICLHEGFSLMVFKHKNTNAAAFNTKYEWFHVFNEIEWIGLACFVNSTAYLTFVIASQLLTLDFPKATKAWTRRCFVSTIGILRFRIWNLIKYLMNIVSLLVWSPAVLSVTVAQFGQSVWNGDSGLQRCCRIRLRGLMIEPRKEGLAEDHSTYVLDPPRGALAHTFPNTQLHISTAITRHTVYSVYGTLRGVLMPISKFSQRTPWRIAAKRFTNWSQYGKFILQSASTSARR